MRGLVTAEFERVMARKSTRIMFGIMVLFPIVTFLLYQVRWGIYTTKINGITYPLNRLNFSVHDLYEWNVLVTFILLPLLYTESLSAETATGAYRLVLLRHHKVWKLLIAKWVSLAVVYALMLLSTFVMKSLIGFIFLPKASVTSYYHIAEKMGVFDSIQYNLNFYMIIYFIHSSLLSLVSCVGVIGKKPIITFIASVSLLVCSLYLFKPLQKIIFATNQLAYYILGGDYDISKLFYGVPIIMLLFLFSLWSWNHDIGKHV
ncbi:hypothetical protein [Brevibacillus laterosporus]|uniref:Uncharacterized protein n=1 Tax=Brevibacillus laterosporus TaxID=1465 RepID=A0AAP3GE53_BRELA|nr:hypothetical protein [Brevibacillus laterosporus]MCR8982768.1 hypothetical protein [Brevibacillus laterosporus]MCZ0809924.1 hypothetical protein [Brevibacillus laterosporus]MCZ0828482.1 hypothetical protein [Brevibacillus laterosporus]MCZ0852531.1 hypothetical protein [Brevibacillus laterosporus]NKQ18747.1 hypothetical protein [Brevibacillus laterosporus]